MDSSNKEVVDELSPNVGASQPSRRSLWLPLLGAGLAIGALFKTSKSKMGSKNRATAVQLRAIKDAVARSRGHSTSKV